MSYDFSTLNDKEFEQLARDVLNEKLGLELQDFAEGRDGGIDLRSSSPFNNNQIVVQVKDYRKSGVTKLLNDLKKNELKKVLLFKPERYLIVTSLELLPQHKDKIVAIFHPYIKSANDIFGSEDLNAAISNTPGLERKWYKLWLSSVNVLDTVLHNAVLGRSAFAESKIRRTIQLYCHSKSYDDALEILRAHKYILITGQPGVGKTTLANFITYELLSENYELIYIDSDVKDAEDLFKNDPKSKQVFYFDDFLGANYLETINPKTSESAFVNFIERIKATEGKYLILTTRTTIFQTAIQRFERMRRVKVDIARKEIQLGNYSDLDKAQILYNHIFHSDLNKYSEEIFTKKNYWKIIRHRNYNPRLIEFITSSGNLLDVPRGGFMKFALHTLDHPEEIWRHAYCQQMQTEEQLLLNAIYSQKYNTQFEQTKEIYELMIKFEVQNFNLKPGQSPFMDSCRKLLDGILTKENSISEGTEIVRFINPSIPDFLTNYFALNEEARWRLFGAAKFIEQFEQFDQYFFRGSNAVLNSNYIEKQKFAKFIIKYFDDIHSYQTLKVEKNRINYDKLRLASLLSNMYISDQNLSDDISLLSSKVLDLYSFRNINRESREYYTKIILSGYSESAIESYVLRNWDNIILALFEIADTESDFDEIIEIFDEYLRELKDFMNDEDIYCIVHPCLTNYIDDQTSDWVQDKIDSIYSYDDWEKSKKDVRYQRAEFLDKFFVEDHLYQELQYFDETDKDSVISSNNYEERDTGPSELLNKKKDAPNVDTEVRKIEELFSGKYDPEDPDLILVESPFKAFFPSF